MRNYDNPLTFILTGSGVSAEKNTRALLEDYIFGNVDNVDVKVIVPFSGKTSAVMTDALKILAEWGITGKDFLPIVEPDSGHRSISAALTAVQVDQGDAMNVALQTLAEEANAGRDVAFVCFYDHNNVRDLGDLEGAKDCEGLLTLNVCEGMIDSFPGYESEADRIIRESLQEAHDEQEKAKAAEEKASAPKPARKTAAKKAATPRKRAAAKPVVVEDEIVTPEAQEALAAPSRGTAGLVADAVAREATRKAEREAKTELSGTIMTNKPELPKDLEPAKLVPPMPDVIEVWEDVAKAAAPTGGTVVVQKADLANITEGIKIMAAGMSQIMDAYNNILGE